MYLRIAAVSAKAGSKPIRIEDHLQCPMAGYTMPAMRDPIAKPPIKEDTNFCLRTGWVISETMVWAVLINGVAPKCSTNMPKTAIAIELLNTRTVNPMSTRIIRPMTVYCRLWLSE